MIYGSYVDELLATQTSAGTSDISGYTLCANEGQAFALPSTCDVAYGANGSFAFRSAQSGTITFTNATFGDPAPGTPKKGYYRLSGGQRFYAHANHLFSIAALTNQSGGVVERYSYDAYGQRKIFAADGITTRAASSYNQQIGFTGRYLDKETGLWYFRARYYSGSLGRFVSRDPGVELSEVLLYSTGKEDEDDTDDEDQLDVTLVSGYVDGFGLYNGYFSPNGVDPTGRWFTWVVPVVVFVWKVVVPIVKWIGPKLKRTTTTQVPPKPPAVTPIPPKPPTTPTSTPTPPKPQPPATQPPRKRGQSDPHSGKQHNPGRDSKGCCKACQLDSPIWRANDPSGHGGNSCHQIRYYQNGKTCECYPSRIDLPCPPGTP